MNFIKRLAYRWVADCVREDIANRLISDADWFIKGTPEELVVREIGNSLKYEGFWNIGDIRERYKLSSPSRNPDKCVIIFQNGQIRTSLDSSNETHTVIAKAFERTMPSRI